MEENIARQEFPRWAALEWREIMENKEPVRIYKPKAKNENKRQPQEQPVRMKLFDMAAQIRKKYGATIVAAAALVAWTLVTCGGTAAIVRHNTTEEVTARVTSELRAGFQQYLADQEYERSAAQFLAGDESLQTAMDAEAEALAKLLYGYRNNSLRDRKTLIWCVLARVDSAAYPGSVAGVVDQKQQWMFYSLDNPIRQDDKDLALEQLQLWHEGKYPAGFSDDYVYAEWSQSDIALRNTWEKDSSTSWWRFPEGSAG